MSRDRGEIQEEKRGGSRGDKNASATNKNSYEIDYSDDRFVKVENDKQAALTENENTYNDMISQSDSYFQSQIDASKQWADKQTQIQNEQTDFAIQQIEQQKENAEKDYIKDQSGAYVDWQTQSKQHGVRAEQMADKGMQNTGYSESSQVSMYNTYQNRVMTAREAFSRAVQNYNNSITQARLTNNAALAEIAKNALQQQLELSLQGFQYKNTLLLDKAAKKLQIEDSYYNRYQDVLQQMNTENALAEQIRQFNESMKIEREQLALQREQLELQRASFSSYSGGGGYSGGGSSTYYEPKKSSDPVVDIKSVAQLGYGPISPAELNKKVASGEVDEYVSGGQIKYVKTTPYTSASANVKKPNVVKPSLM